MCVCALILSAAAPVFAQQTTAATTFSTQPSTFAVRRDILNIQRAQIERQLDIALRCIRKAQEEIQGPRATINRVPLRDLERCTQEVKRLTRRLQGLGREGEKLAMDIEARILTRIQQVTQQESGLQPQGLQ